VEDLEDEVAGLSTFWKIEKRTQVIEILSKEKNAIDEGYQKNTNNRKLFVTIENLTL
jgi:hypothetical protein